ncbi:MAG: aminomethyltransferase family protein, partial [Halanaerobium sp.]
KKLSDIELDDINYYHFEEAEAAGVEMIISRTGYTGELGYELYFAADKAEEIWQRLIKAGEEFKLMPAGLGARNTLRLEKGYALYGNDIDENTNPIEAGLGWTVKLGGEDFIGRDSLLEIKEECCSRRLKGIVITGRGLARHGYDIYAEGEKIGQVTSGSYSPSLKKSIAMGYLNEEYTKTGSKIQIKIRDRFVEAEVVELPFLK